MFGQNACKGDLLQFFYMAVLLSDDFIQLLNIQKIFDKRPEHFIEHDGILFVAHGHRYELLDPHGFGKINAIEGKTLFTHGVESMNDVDSKLK